MMIMIPAKAERAIIAAARYVAALPFAR